MAFAGIVQTRPTFARHFMHKKSPFLPRARLLCRILDFCTWLAGSDIDGLSRPFLRGVRPELAHRVVRCRAILEWPSGATKGVSPEAQMPDQVSPVRNNRPA